MIQKIVYISSDKQKFSTSYAVKNYPSSMTENHYHSFYEILYVLKGERKFQIKDKTYILKAGDAVFVNPYDFHRSIDAENPYYERILISFRKEYITDLAEKTDINMFQCFDSGFEFLHFDDEKRNIIEPVLTKIVNEYGYKKAGYEIAVKCLFMEFLVYVNRMCIEGDLKYNYEFINDTHRRISEIVRFINSNYEQHINLETLSNKFYFSSAYLSRTFKNIMGISLNSYIQHVRVRAAQNLLTDSNYSITKIAELTGFSSINRFEQIFKAVTDKTPSSYRKNAKVQP